MSRPDAPVGGEFDPHAADVHRGDPGDDTGTGGTADGDRDRLDARLRAVERALADGDPPAGDYADAATLSNEVEEVAQTLDDLAARVDDLEAATRALRGYVGEIRSVNDEVEGQAATAIERVDRLGERVASLEERGPDDAADPAAAADPTGTVSARTSTDVGDARQPADPSSQSDDPDERAPDGRQTPGTRPPPSEPDGDSTATRSAAGPFAEALEHGVVPSSDTDGRARRSRPGIGEHSDGRDGLGAALLSRLRAWL